MVLAHYYSRTSGAIAPVSAALPANTHTASRPRPSPWASPLLPDARAVPPAGRLAGVPFQLEPEGFVPHPALEEGERRPSRG